MVEIEILNPKRQADSQPNQKGDQSSQQKQITIHRLLFLNLYIIPTVTNCAFRLLKKRNL